MPNSVRRSEDTKVVTRVRTRSDTGERFSECQTKKIDDAQRVNTTVAEARKAQDTAIIVKEATANKENPLKDRSN